MYILSNCNYGLVRRSRIKSGSETRPRQTSPDSHKLQPKSTENCGAAIANSRPSRNAASDDRQVDRTTCRLARYPAFSLSSNLSPSLSLTLSPSRSLYVSLFRVLIRLLLCAFPLIYSLSFYRSSLGRSPFALPLSTLPQIILFPLSFARFLPSFSLYFSPSISLYFVKYPTALVTGDTASSMPADTHIFNVFFECTSPYLPLSPLPRRQPSGTKYTVWAGLFLCSRMMWPATFLDVTRYMSVRGITATNILFPMT